MKCFKYAMHLHVASVCSQVFVAARLPLSLGNYSLMLVNNNILTTVQESESEKEKKLKFTGISVVGARILYERK